MMILRSEERASVERDINREIKESSLSINNRIFFKQRLSTHACVKAFLAKERTKMKGANEGKLMIVNSRGLVYWK